MVSGFFQKCIGTLLPLIPAVLRGVLGLALFHLVSGRALAANQTWDGSDSTNFETPANWSVLPSNDLTSDIGVFSGSVTANQPQLSASRSINGLLFSTPAGGWTLGSGGMGNVISIGVNGVSAAGQGGGTNTIAANVSLAAAQTWMVGTGGRVLAAGSITQAAGFSSWTINSSLNLGILTLSPATGNSVNISGVNDGSSLIQVKSGGIFQLGGTGPDATASVNTIKSTSSTGGYGTWGITGGGKLQVNSGTWLTGDLGKNGGDNFSGTIEVNGGAISFTGARYLGSGTIRVNGGSLSVTNFGSAVVNGGRFSLGAFASTGTATMTITGGSVDLAQANGGNSFGTAASTQVSQIGGTLQSGLTVAGGTNGGTANTLTLGHSGMTSTGSGATLTFTPVSNIIASYTLTGGTLLSAGAIQGTAPATAGTNGSSATPPSVVVNPGTGNIRNFNFNGGTLVTAAFNAANLGYSSSTGVAGGSPHADPAANSVGIGTLYNNGGKLAPGGAGVAGKTFITGNYVVNTGSLAVDLGGTVQATAFQAGQYDFLTVSGTSALGGDLVVKVLPGFSPSASDTFTILSSTGSLSGAFANVPFGGRVVSDDGLSTFVVSQVGNTVTLGQYLPVTAPVVTTTFAPSTVVAGDSVVLGVSVSSLVPVTYEWRRNGVLISGAVSSALTFNSVQPSDAGTYEVTITNANGPTTRTFTLKLTTPVSTQGSVIAAGTSQAFAAAPAATSYAWTLDGMAVGTGADSFTYTPDISAVGTHWLRVKETYVTGSPVVRQWGVRVKIPSVVGGLKYYVSPTGSNTANGSISTPFLTLEKARDTIRLLPRPLPAGGVTVYLRGGTHFRTGTFSLTTSDSGTASAPITYTAYPGETPIVSGAKNILASQFAPLASTEVFRAAPGVDTSRIWEADLTALGISHKGPFPNTFNEWQIFNALGSGSAGLFELFYNGRRMHLSRYPNHHPTDETLTTSLKMNGIAAGADAAGTGFLNAAGNYTDSNGNVVAVGGAFQYNTVDAAHVSRWQTAMTRGGVWAVGYWRVPWQINGGKIGILDTGSKQVIGFANGVNISNGIGYKYSRPLGNKAEPWWVVNLLEELDQPGEWCVDFSRGKLYFLMDAAGAPPDNSVALSDLGTALVQIAGSYVNFEGIRFEYGLGQGVQVLGGSRNLVTGCSFRNMGGYPVDLNNLSGGTSNGVVSCEMTDLASGGVLVRGGNNTSTPRVPTNNFVVNNRIKDYARVVRVYAAAVDVGFQYGKPAVGVRVAHNRTSGSPHGAIQWKDYDHVIEFNEISDYCQYSNDFGGIYTFNPNYLSNTVIRYNHLHDSDHGEGIYFDSDHINSTVYGNVVNLHSLESESRGTGFYDQAVNGAPKADVPYTDASFNNISVNARYGFQFYSTTGGKIENNLAYNNRSSAYRWNLVNVGTTTVTSTASTAAVLGSGPNQAYTVNPGFIDFAADDLRLRPDAKAYSDMPDFQPVPLEMSGLYNDEYRTDTTVRAPFVVTGIPTAIGGNTVTLSGSLVYPQFERNATVRLYWGVADGGSNPAAWGNVTVLGQPGSGELAKTMTDLAPGTRYFYRFHAVNSAGEHWAEESDSFTTYALTDAPTGGTVTASSAAAPAADAFDGNPATAWKTDSGLTGVSLSYHFASDAAVRVTRYQVTSAADLPALDPRDWQFLGSFDGVNWITLDSRTNQVFTARGQTLTYGFSNETPFKFYQLNITANNGGTTGLQLAELKLSSPVNVPDSTGPVIITPGNLSVIASNSSGATVEFAVSAVDAVSGNAPVTASPASGSLFPVGNTTVNVSATDAAGNTSTASFTVTVTLATVPAPWTVQQVGAVANGVAGTASYDAQTGRFNITGGGGDIWSGTTEAFTFVNQPWSGNGIFTARIVSFSSSDSAAKAGLMVRESNTAGARNSIVYLTRAGSAFTQHKTTTNGTVANTTTTGKAAPYWVRLVRNGNSFSGFISPDGVTWTQLGATTTNTMPINVQVGLASGPRMAGTTSSVVMDNVSLVGVPAAPSGLTATGGSGRIALSWNSVPGATGYTVIRSDNTGGSNVVIASGLTAPTYTDTGLPPDTAFSYIVSASNTVGDGPGSNEAAATTLTALLGWRVEHFSTTSATGDAADLADPDADGMCNLLEYALGTVPVSAASVATPVLGRGGDFLTLTFNRTREDVTYIVEGCDDLATWTPLATNPGVVGASVTVSDSVSISSAIPPRRFLHLRVISP